MVENTGMPEYSIQGEVSRYISLPGQATAYYIGYTKILETPAASDGRARRAI